MTLQMTTPLPAHTLLIEGPDAIAFAQSQFSNNIAALPNGRWQFSAWLDAQGRVRALFHLLRLDDERLLLLLRGDHPDELASSLQQFVFRAKVRLTHSSSSMLACGPARPIFDVNCDGDLIELGCGNHSLLCGNHLSGDDSWRRLQLLDGWAWLPEAATNTLLPPRTVDVPIARRRTGQGLLSQTGNRRTTALPRPPQAPCASCRHRPAPPARHGGRHESAPAAGTSPVRWHR